MKAIIGMIFPTGEVRSDGYEVNGLAKNTNPVNCVILKQGRSRFEKKERREWFVVEVDTFVIMFRICAAYPDSGYDEYVAVHGFASKEDIEEVENIHDFFTRQTSDSLDGE